MKLIGNSVSVPVIDKLCQAIIDTGVFEYNKEGNSYNHVNNKLVFEESMKH